jgi:protein phosphatase
MQPAPGPAVRLRIEFDQASDPGRDPNKQVNEDSCGYAETRLGHLCVLCDGMGGHYGGKEASRLAIATIFEVFEQAPWGMAPVDALKAAIEEAGRRVYRLGGPPENRTRPGSTVVAMVLHDRGVDVAHVGDSRAYCIRSGQIYPLTRDHSMVQGMIDAGLLTEAQAIGHPDANKITRALGMKPECEVEVRPEPMELFVGDVLLMSSDGLTDLVLPHDILATARTAFAQGGVPAACRALVAIANERGGHDNITVQMARVVDVPKKNTTIPESPASSHRAAPIAEAPPSVRQPGWGVAPTAPDPTYGRAPAGNWGGGAVVPGPIAGQSPAASTLDATPPPGGGPTSATYGARPGAPPSYNPAPAGQAPSGWPGAQHGAPQAPPYAMAPPQPIPPTGVGPTAVTQGPVSNPYGAPPPSAPARSPHGGLVYLIIGMSAVIAVLVIIVIWALFFRG